MKQIPGSNPSGGIRPGLPVLLQSVLIGFLVSSAGISVWSLFLLNIKAPWSAFAMLIVLWAYLKWFSGSWAPKSNQLIRRERFRKTRLPLDVWIWGLFAALLFVVVVQASFFITFRIFEFPADRFTADYKMLDRMPVGNAWVLIVMGSVVAGICEETGFRGFMQVPLEKKFGPAAGILISSIFFMLIHLSHSWAAPILPHIFFASVLLGILAFRSGSLVPGIVGHSILDIFDYGIWWSNITGGFHRKTIFVTGIDFHFIICCLVFALALFAFLRSVQRIRNKADFDSQSPREMI
jgi:membrane protease YdiL (CAAX protease family)